MNRRRNQRISKKELLKKSSQISEEPLEVKPTPKCTNSHTFVESWAPCPYTAFKALLSARLCAAVWNNISDCDEVYNYWEPTHYLMYGRGMQTWEYSPVYAIRSYAYLCLHAIFGLFYSNLLQSNRMLVFYFMRCILGFASACCEVYFYKGVLHHFGPNVARIMLVIMLFSTGMFISSTAYLPSTFSMYMLLLSFGGWFLRRYEVCVFSTAVSVLLGWPFVIAVGLPAAFDIIIAKKRLFAFIKYSVISLIIILPPLVIIDTHFYGKPVLAPLNIVMYNVFSSHGANLYGIEPWTFYFKNATLNFNIVFWLAIIVLPMVGFVKLKGVSGSSYPVFLEVLPLYIWCLIFFMQAHKEERFLFPVYPLICLAAAISVDYIQMIFHDMFFKKWYLDYKYKTNFVWIIFLLFTTVISISRTIALYRGFHAPMEIYMELGKIANENETKQSVNLCVGKEWYRFPSSYFLPDDWHLKFIESEFRGQLPKPYSDQSNATRIIPTGMNDLNLEERSRYTPLAECDYLVDTDFPSNSAREPNYAGSQDWKILSSIPFLDSNRSPVFARAFYIPFVTEKFCTYVNYNLLKRDKPRVSAKLNVKHSRKSL